MSDPRLPAHPAQTVDRARRVTYDFEGRPIPAGEGDSVAAALYAAGIRIFSRGFKYHRPRGLLCCAGRCPNCLMNVDGTPSVRTCVEPVRDGMRVRHQNAWPTLERDLFSVIDKFDRLLPVGFYYKTFIHPRRLWPAYEWVLRHLAGLGELDLERTPGAHGETVHLFPDVTVVGGGPAGCAAALEAARLGASVLLVDDQPLLGGALRTRLGRVDGPGGLAGLAGWEAARRLAAEVEGEPRIQRLQTATAFGVYEGLLLGVMQGRRLYRVRMRQLVVATGGFEHPLVFQGNDLPGVFLGTGLQRLITLDGVRPGRAAVVVTNADHGWAVAQDLLAVGVEVAAVAEARPELPPAAEALAAAGVKCFAGTTIHDARGRRHVEGALLVRLDAGGDPVAGSERLIACDLIAVSTTPEPAGALLAQADGRLGYDPALDAVVPQALASSVHAAGAVTGLSDLGFALLGGRLAGLEAASALGLGGGEASRMATLRAEVEAHRARLRRGLRVRQLTSVPSVGRKRFVCLCEDVTEKDLADAVREGFDHLETLKRYTTVTMGPCQGKMCHLPAIGVTARLTGRGMAETGTTTARPPVQPVPLGVLAGPHHEPVRRTPLHARHAALGATWMDMGAWKRPLLYTSVEAEVRAVREAVGLIDVSTLGKLEVVGREAAAFLEWIHPGRVADLAVGRIRYRVMCDDAGIILDDGTTARLGEDRFFVTTGTGSLEAVGQWLEWWLAGTGRCVHVADVTSAYAAVNLAGPKCREVLARLTDLDLSPGAFPYMAVREALVGGVPALLLRIGFVGELGYEIHAPAEYGAWLWDLLLDAGREHGIRPFGVEAQRVLRLEKLHLIPGHDTDALSNPLEADMAWAVKLDKPDFIGRRSLEAARARGLRQRLVGFELLDGVVPGEGDTIVADGRPIGRVTSSKWSPTLGRGIGMAWIPPELAREGAEFEIRSQGRLTRGRVVVRPFYDPDGARLK
ncbi:MAG: (2Fe-2S)-binding protein, partial [Candidatus Rokubacteria bacterium]|nr:(2Fe-2S)-binding protein [Candidatus Rokubacteria bacterium]